MADQRPPADPPSGISRRRLLQAGLAGAGALVLDTQATPTLAAAPLVRRSTPRFTSGIQSGDVTSRSAVIWTRSDRPARMSVEIGGRGRGRRVRGPLLLPDSDFTGRVVVRGLPAGSDVPYRVVLTDPEDRHTTGESLRGTVRTAPRHRRSVRLHWSGDQAGQGWGINPDIGGYRLYDAMLERDPDLFLHCGDTIYADGPIAATQQLPDGRTYRNVVTEEKSHVAETLADFRGAFRYNLIDEPLRRFASRVPQVNQWDDHEVHNNWWPGQIIDDVRYTERRADVLAARARQAWHEYVPVDLGRSGEISRVVRYGPLADVFVLDMRTYRNANSSDDQPTDEQGILGQEQADWLVDQLDRSRATWKVVQSDMPLGVVVADGPRFEAVAQGQPGLPLGREGQIARMLSEIKRRQIRNVVWVTADVHYAAAHHYDPSRASYTDFDPFWEFVAGPINAGAFGPGRLDATFGPRAEFTAAPPRQNTSPLEGFQFFGELSIDGDTGVLTASLLDQDGTLLFSRALDPQR